MKPTHMILLLLCLFTMVIPPTINAESLEDVKVAIIIDDFGGDVKGVHDFFQTKIPITVAVMPFLEQSKKQAELAHSLGLEVMIHLPLQPKKGKSSWLGPNPITKDLSLTEVKKRVVQAIESVPHAKGMNNHMGSLIVEDEAIMRVILETAKEYNLYFIDSGTAPNSVIPRLAEELGVPWGMRDIFLDDTHSSSSHVYKQMNKLVKVAERKGHAIGIGHVGVKGDATVKGVTEAVKSLKQKNVKIVPASHLLQSKIDKSPENFWHGYLLIDSCLKNS
ncbi:divergent polysaccharide deacetylase family protein [Anaerobacillus sp. CMMVII]|uniref:divergent polysaccharide deacetylase family protein n=1 Tax=Anaerobacillus sp. CMMVII TaxID=2755588 RepID=UPI0021B82594|nr:divergent polysaccharide deacetylase family protein [Anaerobacillus sp. CMMVII]MCT8138753.1 divergent polysaccharide deacetylase family protein [Anaerobacillus sp. CMMVII]